MIFDIVSSFGEGNVQALSTVKQISEIRTIDEEVIFDFTRYKENNPFSNLLISNALVAYKQNHPEVRVSLIPKTDSNYLSHLGFYDLIGANYGKKIGDAEPNANYVPILKIDLDSKFYTEIENKSRQLAALLAFDKDLSSFLSYVFVETIRNVYEHAEIRTAYVCAQKWTSFNLVEIAIVDNGCGVATAMNKIYKNRTEDELMHLAALPGVSAMSNHAYLEKDDFWRNSGYGLYALRRLSNVYKGSFLLCSGGRALHQRNGKTKKYDTQFKGTAIAMRFRTDTDNVFKKELNNIIREGEIKAKQLGRAILKASKSSGGQYYV